MMGNLIHEYIHLIENKNKQNEYYFTDIVGLIGKNHKIQAIRVSEDEKTKAMSSFSNLPDVCAHVFKWANPALFFVYFRSFQTQIL